MRQLGLGIGSGVATAGAAFVPLLGYSAWFDASDLATVFQDDAGTVPVTADGQAAKCWTSKGAVQCSAASFVSDGYQPPTYYTAGINGKPAILLERGGSGGRALSTAKGVSVGSPIFSSANGLTLAAAGTAFFVWKADANSLFVVADDGGYGKLLVGYSHPGAAALNIYLGGDDVELPFTPTATGTMLVYGWNGTSKFVGVDDFSDAAIVSNASAGWNGSGSNLQFGSLNGSVSIHGWLGDAIFYRSWLSEADRLAMRVRLGAKYGF